MAVSKTYPAATLMEAVVAMVIMAFILSLGIVLFDRLWQSGTDRADVKGRLLTSEALYGSNVRQHRELFVDTVLHPTNKRWFVVRSYHVMETGDTTAVKQKIYVPHE